MDEETKKLVGEGLRFLFPFDEPTETDIEAWSSNGDNGEEIVFLGVDQ
jgi:hypothetical protein